MADQIEVDHDDARVDPHRPALEHMPALDSGQHVNVRLRFTSSDANRLLHLTITALDGSGRIAAEFEEPGDAPGTGLQYLPPKLDH